MMIYKTVAPIMICGVLYLVLSPTSFAQTRARSQLELSEGDKNLPSKDLSTDDYNNDLRDLDKAMAIIQEGTLAEPPCLEPEKEPAGVKGFLFKQFYGERSTRSPTFDVPKPFTIERLFAKKPLEGKGVIIEMEDPIKKIDPKEEKGKKSKFKVKIEPVTIQTSGNIELRGEYFEPLSSPEKPLITPRKTAVLMMGTNGPNTEYSKEIVELLVKNKINVLAVDYRGFGASTGIPSEKGLYADGRAMVEYLKHDKQIPLQNMILWGFSMGGAIAAKTAESYPQVNGLILDRTLTSMKSATQAHLSVPLVNRMVGHVSRYKLGEFDTEKSLQGFLKKSKQETYGSKTNTNVLFISAGREDVLTQTNKKLAKRTIKSNSEDKEGEAKIAIQTTEADDAGHTGEENNLKVLKASCLQILTNFGLKEDEMNCP